MRILALLAVLAAPLAAEPYPLDAVPEGPLWHVTEIGGTALPAGIAVNFTRLKEGVLGGSAGCNSFTMRIGQDHKRLYPAPVALTRMACDSANMRAEAAFVAAMGRLFSLAHKGETLRLLAEDGAVLLRARR